MPQKVSKIKEASWNSTYNRAVAFIDIMGFKDMVARDHEEVHKLMTELSGHNNFNTPRWREFVTRANTRINLRMASFAKPPSQ